MPARDFRCSMDQSVLDAIVRWPDVPAVAGWLSLNCRGLWRLHPLGDAAGGGPGESITNEQILRFIDRNYSHDARGAWYFQNGPQRVYARLDAAPYILRLDPATAILTTHNGLTVSRVNDWIADDAGNLYAATDIGPGRVDDRDLPALADLLANAQGSTLLDLLEDGSSSSGSGAPAPLLRARTTQQAGPGAEPISTVSPMAQTAPLTHCAAADIPERMGFIANPTANHV